MRMNYVLRPRTQHIHQELQLLTIQESKIIHHLARISRIFEKSKIGALSKYKTFLHEIIRWIILEQELSNESRRFLEREIEKKTRRLTLNDLIYIKIDLFKGSSGSCRSFKNSQRTRRKVSWRKMFQWGLCSRSAHSSIQVRDITRVSGLSKCLSSGYNLSVQLSALLGHKEVDKLKRKLQAYGLGEIGVNTFKFVDLFEFPLHVDMDR